ncbi:hypothetical protein Peur_034882 [Populus x canadensis]
MAVRSLLALMVLLFCLAEVSSDLKIDTEIPQLVVRGGNRRLMQDIGTPYFVFFLPSFDTYCDGFNPLYMECLIALFHFYIFNISFSIDLQIVEGYASNDAVFTQGLICATGHVAPAV